MAKNINLSTTNAVSEIKKLIAELKKLDRSLGKVSTGNIKAFNEVTSSVSALKTNITSLNKFVDRLSSLTKTNSKNLRENTTQLRRNSSSVQTNSREQRKAKNAVEKLTRSLNKSTVATNKDTSATKRNTGAKNKNSSSMKKMMRNLSNLAGALGFAGFIAVLGRTLLGILTLTIKFQSLGFALKQTANDLFETGRSMQFLLDLNNRFGADLSSTTERWLKFRTAARQSGLTLLETKKIFESVTKASAVLGLRTDELRGVYLALEQMLSKGKVTTEELRRQLGERLPGAMGIMAASMGVTIAELDKMLKKGEVLSAEVLPEFARQLERAYGIESLNTVDNLSTGVGKLTGQWEQLVLAITEGDSLISGAIGGTMSMIESLLLKLTNLSSSFAQKARASQSFFNPAILKEYSDRSTKIIEDNNEFLESEDSLRDRRLATIHEITAAQAIGDKKAERALNEKLNGIQQEILLIEKRRAVLEQTDAESRLQGEVLKTKELKDALVAAGEDTKSLWDNVKDLGRLVEQFSSSSVVQFDDEGAVKQNEYLDEREQILSTLTEKQKEYVKQLEREGTTRELAEKNQGTAVTTGNKEPTAIPISVIKAQIRPENNELLIKELKEEIRLRQELATLEPGVTGDSDELKFARRVDMAFQTSEDLDRINQLEIEDRHAANKIWAANEEAKLVQNLTRHKEEGKRRTEQEDENILQRGDNLKEFERRKQEIDQDSRFKIQQNLEQGNKEWEAIMRDHFAQMSSEEATNVEQQIQAINRRLQQVRKGSNEEARLLLEIQDIEARLHNFKIHLEIKEIERQKSLVTGLEEEERLLTDILKLKNQLLGMPSESAEIQKTGDLKGGTIIDETFARDFSNIAGATQDFTNAMFGFANQLYQNKIDKIDKEIEKEEEKYDRLLELAKNDESEKKIIERNREISINALEKKKRKEQKKQAKLNKALAISQITQQTAVAVINALASPGIPYPIAVFMAAAAAATGAFQLATAIATPIPEFAKGGEMTYDGKAKINDGGRQEYVERNGSLLTTTKKDAIVDLKQGDIIHPNFEAMQRKTMLLSLMHGGNSVTEKEVNLALGIKEEIKEGFKRSKINNSVTVLNKMNDYKGKMSMWN
jgi:tape measure domain-containing protein